MEDEIVQTLQVAGTTYATTIVIVMVLNAIIGITAFNWAWKKSDRFRNPNTKLVELFPAYRRTDA